jgi:hypothetical protein
MLKFRILYSTLADASHVYAWEDFIAVAAHPGGNKPIDEASATYTRKSLTTYNL